MSKTKIIILALIAGFIMGNISGFMIGAFSVKGVQQLFADMLTDEKPAEVKTPLTLRGKFYLLSYPGNWKVDRSDPDFDSEHLFSIDSPGSCFVQVLIMESGTDPSENVEEQYSAMVPTLLKSPTRTPFTRWGKYKGTGIEVKGRMLGLQRGGIRIFSHSTATCSFTITEFYYDEDLAKAGPGFKLIENSFVLNEDKK